MPRSDSKYLATLAYWTVYQIIEEGYMTHPDQDWCEVSIDDNINHLQKHVANLIASLNETEAAIMASLKKPMDEDASHILCRAAMLYWSYLAKDDRIPEVLAIPPEFAEYLKSLKK